MGHAAHDYCWRGVCASTTRDTLPCSLSARRGSHISPLFLRTSPSPKWRDLFAVSTAAQTFPLLTFATLRRATALCRSCLELSHATTGRSNTLKP